MEGDETTPQGGISVKSTERWGCTIIAVPTPVAMQVLRRIEGLKENKYDRLYPVQAEIPTIQGSIGGLKRTGPVSDSFS